MSEYKVLMEECRDRGATMAKSYIPRMYEALRKDNKKPDEARIIIEHDLGDIFAKRTIIANLPDECKSEKAKELAEKRKEFTKETIAATTAAEEAQPELRNPPIVMDTAGKPVDNYIDNPPMRTLPPSPQSTGRVRYPFDLERNYSVLNQNYRQGRKIIYIVIENGIFAGFEYK